MFVWLHRSWLLAVVVPFSGCAIPKTISTATLLAEMTNLASLAEYPDPPYACRQYSSYDPASTTPDDPKGWFANNDAGNYLRVEERDGRKEYVIMDADGPGAIVRIWSANPAGVLRIYLDGRATPMLETSMADLLGGKLPGLPAPIACERSAGWNSYFPIPYAKHCKVTGDRIVSDDGRARVYYHVNYRTYPRATRVTSFVPSDLETLAPQVKSVAQSLDSPRTCGPGLIPWDGLCAQGPVPLPPRGARPVSQSDALVWTCAAKQPQAIVGLRAKVQARDLEAALRHVVLTMTFDDERTVVCPLGDFFGAAPGVNAYASLPLGVGADGEMWSHWVMPFRRLARLEFRNLGDEPAELLFGVLAQPRVWTSRSLYFHAQWRAAFDVATRPMQDWNYLTTRGRGVFVGAAFAIANPVKQWWGEGDEKIYVDGEKFPSHFGTGTEDYYGYAWCCNVPFTHAYHNQPRCDGPANYGHTAVNRWHIMDRIPFQRDFRFDMELWHWWDGRVPQMSVVSYWYARPGARSDRAEPSPADLRVTKIPPYVAPRVAGALEGEELKIVASTGRAAPQNIEACSNDQHLWWRDGKPGDKLVLAFTVPDAGRYRVRARFLKAHDYGIIQLAVNDQNAGEPLDFYNAGIALTEELTLGEFALAAGENRLSAEIIGANAQAAKGYMFGLDYLRLEPVR